MRRADRLLQFRRRKLGKHDFIVVNFANGAEMDGISRPREMTEERLTICPPKDAGHKVLLVILDGRSTESGSAPELVLELEDELQKLGVGQIVDCVGRGIVLDRDHDYEKVKRGYDAMVLGTGKQYLFDVSR